ncbi:MAG TPA: HAD family hydrolase [Gemmatimonadaceae bacterium]|nr:HAD family hydrolase [Gemmatimonadaceae bacterium]
MTARAAVFLDRDGTIVKDVNYLARPEQLVLIPGAVVAMARLSEAGLPLIVVTNQSGIGRGMFTEADFTAITARLDAMLKEHGVTVLATYHCPDTPEVPAEISCRKPGDRMHLQAATDHDIDLKKSFYIGDMWRDVQPAVTHDAMGILVPTPDTPYRDLSRAKDDAVVATTLGAAVDRVLRMHASRR